MQAITLVTNIRNLIYKRKVEIIKTPMVRDIMAATFSSGLPMQIWATREGVFAGGDAVTGAATVISAMGAGKVAAKAIDEYVLGKSKKSKKI